jgi:hypothetical protein
MTTPPTPVLLSTGDIRAPYRIIGPVFAYASSRDGVLLRSDDPTKACEKVADMLRENAAAAGGNGIIHAAFDCRVSVDTAGAIYEVFAYGTAVAISPEDDPAPQRLAEPPYGPGYGVGD